MGRAPCCDKANVKKGPWSPQEDDALKDYIEKNGTAGNWISLPQRAGLKRCGKSCRLRWLNYLRPNIKHGDFSDDEDRIICTLYSNIGSRWSIIAAQLPGRTDNDIKNYWNTKLKKKLMNMSMIHPTLNAQPKLQSTPGLPSLYQFNPSIPKSPISAATSSSSSSSSSSSLFNPAYSNNNNAISLAEPIVQPSGSPNYMGYHQANQMGFEGFNTYYNSDINGDNITDYGMEEIKELIGSTAIPSNSSRNFLFEDNKMYY